MALVYVEERCLQNVAKKLRKHELDLKILVTARATGVYPKFTRWKIRNVKVDFIVAYY